MLPLNVAHALLVLSSAVLTLALASMSPVNVMLAVAAHFIVGQIVGQAMVAERDAKPATTRSRSVRRSRDRSG
jgi:hypothetical protein